MTKSRGTPKLVLILTVLPAVILASAMVGVAWFCRTLLQEAERVDVELPSLLPLFLGVFGICLVSCLLVVLQGLRLQRRLAGPTLRVIAGMQRVRAGDLSFRIHLRRGDYLSEIAFEFNKVIDWLNENPPEGARTGSDVVDVYAVDHDEDIESELDEIDLGVRRRGLDSGPESSDLEPEKPESGGPPAEEEEVEAKPQVDSEEEGQRVR